MAPDSVAFAFSERISRIELEISSASSCTSEVGRTGTSASFSWISEHPERIKQKRIAQAATLHVLLVMLDSFIFSQNHGYLIPEDDLFRIPERAVITRAALHDVPAEAFIGESSGCRRVRPSGHHSEPLSRPSGHRWPIRTEYLFPGPPNDRPAFRDYQRRSQHQRCVGPTQASPTGRCRTGRQYPRPWFHSRAASSEFGEYRRVAR